MKIHLWISKNPTIYGYRKIIFWYWKLKNYGYQKSNSWYRKIQFLILKNLTFDIKNSFNGSIFDIENNFSILIIGIFDTDKYWIKSLLALHINMLFQWTTFEYCGEQTEIDLRHRYDRYLHKPITNVFSILFTTKRANLHQPIAIINE